MDLHHTLIIGYGSELRGDDALGPRVAAELAQRLEGDPAVRVLARPSLTPELAADLAEADRAIFIDCAATGPVGRVVRRRVEPRDDASASMVHFLDPPALLHWTRRLFGRCPEAVVLTAAGQSFDIAEALTPPLAAAVPRLVDRAVGEVARQPVGGTHLV